MTAREFQQGLPSAAVAAQVTAAAGWKPASWRMAVTRGQTLTPQQLVDLAEALVAISAEMRGYAKEVRSAR